MNQNSPVQKGNAGSGSDADSILWTLGSICFFLLAWKVLALTVTHIRGIPFPGPWDCLKALIHYLRGAIFLDHSIYHHCLVSLSRWIQGFSLGALAGTAYALAAGWNLNLRRITMPTVEIMQVIPGLAWIPVAILVFGLNHCSTVALIAVTAFPAVAISGVMGVRSVDPRFVRAARMCGAGPLTLFATVLLPGSLAHLLSGIRVAMGASWRVLVAAEMIVGSGDGLGYAIIQSRWTMDYVSAFICIGIIAGLGLFLERAVMTPLENLTVRPWGMSNDH